MSKIVAHYQGQVVFIYLVNGDFKEVYRGYSTENCKEITGHEVTKTEKVVINTASDNTPTVHIMRGVNNTEVETYYVDEIYQLIAGEIRNCTDEKNVRISF